MSSLVLIATNVTFGELIPPYKTPLWSIVSSVPQEEYPSYKDGVLTIPRVDINEKDGLGIFQDARFSFSDGNWKLLDFKTANATPRLFQVVIHKVKLIIIDSFPVQVFLRVTGNYSEQCAFLYSNKIPRLKATQRLLDNRFEIIIYQNGYQDGTDNLPVNYGEMCTIAPSSSRRFETIIPLSTYGLRAGTYQYIVSRANHPNSFYDPTNPSSLYVTPDIIPDTTGSFELKKDNLFPAEDISDPLDDA